MTAPTAPFSPDEFDEILGAYALDAVDADEALAVEQYLRDHPEREHEVERLRAAAAWYGASETESPPAALREAIFRRLPARPVTVAGLIPHRAAGQLLHDVVGSLEAADETTVTINGLDVHDLVAHLVALESLVAEWAGWTTEPELSGQDIEGRTAEACAALAGASLAELQTEWDKAAAAVRAAASRGEPLPFFGELRSASDLLSYRAFETWIHAGDIEVARGGVRPPLPRDAFAVMATASMGLIPACMTIRDVARPGESARIVISGTDEPLDFLVPLSLGDEPAAEPSVVVRTNVFDWCVRIGDRIEPDAMAVELGGDVDLGRELLAAANSFATL
jgi:uncharacterized protein (TIGR03083 family)